MLTRNRTAGMASFLLAATLLLALAAGCNKGGGADKAKADSAPRQAPTTQQQMQAVQNNPHIPAETKAKIIRQMQGKLASPAAAPAPK